MAITTYKKGSVLLQVLSITFLLLLLATMPQAQEDGGTTFQKRLDQAQMVMSDKGYTDMALMLYSIQHDLEILDLQNKTYTIFAPDDASFEAGSNSYPPVSLVEYHVVPLKVDRGLLESPAMTQQKMDTLLQGHPLVVTTGLPESYMQPHLYLGEFFHPYMGEQYIYPSLNLVTVHEWDVYNDGHLIVHGLREFLRPDFQRNYYPWFNEPDINAPTISPTTAPRSAPSPAPTSSRSSSCLWFCF